MLSTSSGLSVTCLFFFFNDTATTEIYTLSLHDALPICSTTPPGPPPSPRSTSCCATNRSEEHTSELQSLAYLVCRLLLEKKNTSHHLTFHANAITAAPPQIHGKAHA